MNDPYNRDLFNQPLPNNHHHSAAPDLGGEPPPAHMYQNNKAYEPYSLSTSNGYSTSHTYPIEEYDEDMAQPTVGPSSSSWTTSQGSISGDQPTTYDALEHARISPSNLDPDLFVPAFVSPRFASGGMGAAIGAGPVVVEPTWGGGGAGGAGARSGGGVNVALTRRDSGGATGGGGVYYQEMMDGFTGGQGQGQGHGYVGQNHGSPGRSGWGSPHASPLTRRPSGGAGSDRGEQGGFVGNGMSTIMLGGTHSSQQGDGGSIGMMGPPPVPLMSTSASIYSRRYSTDPTAQYQQQEQHHQHSHRRESYPPTTTQHHPKSPQLSSPVQQQFQRQQPSQAAHHQRRPSLTSPILTHGNVAGTTSDPSSPVYDLYGSSVYAIQPPSLDTLRLSGQAIVAAAESMVASSAPGGVILNNDTRLNEGDDPPFDPGSLGLPLPPKKEDGETNWRGMYSTSGIDMIGVLAKVAMRKNPEISIGPVDMGCSFLVVDARKFDNPIVYASETFTHLTGYSNSEILGRNCRFLQSPDGIVEPGSKRRYTDGNAVYHLKQHITSGKETQASLINYAKGGRPFINLVTCIPITWESDEIAFFVGFQVDLVDQPAAILEKMKNGTYIVNYSVSAATIPSAPSLPSLDTITTSTSDKVTNSGGRKKIAAASMQPEVLETTTTSELLDELAVGKKGVQGLRGDDLKKQFFKLMLDHCDDFVHVLSLKGSLLYVSESASRLLEYEPGELSGTSLSSICHPSDIVSVLRELKESGAPGHEVVNILYRARRKHSGYVWIEGTGRLFVEQGKGRKCVILVGRPTDVLHVQWSSLEQAGGLGQVEFWAKLSVTGMVLHATPAVKQVLGVPSEEMSGRNISSFDESGVLLAALAELVASGESGLKTVQHKIKAKTGIINVTTNLYPTGEAGDDDTRKRIPRSVIAQTIRTPGDGTHARTMVTKPTLSRSRSSSVSLYSVAGSSSGSGSSMSLPLPAFKGMNSDTDSSSGTSSASSFSAIPSTFKTLTQAATDNIFDELDTTRGTSWQFELHQLRLQNKKLREEKDALSVLQRKKRKRDAAQFIVPTPPTPGGPKACANCGRTGSPEWRTGPTGPKTLCNACGLRWSKARPQLSSATSTSSVQTWSLSGNNSRPGSSSGSVGSPSGTSTLPTPVSSLPSKGSDDPTRPSLGHFPSSFEMSYSPAAFGAAE